MAFGYPGYNQLYQPNYPGQQMYGQPNYTQYGQSQQQMQAQNGLNRVTGFEGARAFAVPPNSVVPLFDDTQDVFYIKTTDSGGFPTIKPYRFAPMEESPVQQLSGGLSRAEVEQIVREEMQKYGKQFVQEYTAGDAAGYNTSVRELPASTRGTKSKANTEPAGDERQSSE